MQMLAVPLRWRRSLPIVEIALSFSRRRQPSAAFPLTNQEPHQSFRKRSVRIRRDQHTIFAVMHQLGCAADRRSDDRQTNTHRLQYNVRKSFVRRIQHEKIAAGHQTKRFGFASLSRKVNPIDDLIVLRELANRARSGPSPTITKPAFSISASASIK